ncbi:hypothetical protein C0J52_21010 [Blattella germanica]|nr:hypothetical protein C0J52_21010 [Blattella germanica]
MTHVGPVKFISRDEWGAKPSLEPLKRLQHPVPYVVLTHTGGEEVTTEDKCKSLMRIIQQRYFDCANWVDVAQNYLIGGDGNVYEGRGWDLKGAFAEEYNPLSIGIGMIGNFSRVLPSNKQLRALVYCIQEGVRLGKISQDYKILTHQQLKGSISPGTSFIRLIKTWPRWSDTPRRKFPISNLSSFMISSYRVSFSLKAPNFYLYRMTHGNQTFFKCIYLFLLENLQNINGKFPLNDAQGEFSLINILIMVHNC